MNKTLIAAATLAFGGFAMSASAATTAPFQVTANVVSACAVSTNPIAFGAYDPTSATAVAATGAVKAFCTKGSSVSVALDQGTTPGTGSTAIVPARQMKNGANLLPYHIYIANTGTTEWGNTVASEPVAQVSASVLTQLSFTTYGSLPAGADVPVGNYADTVTATVTF